MLIYPDIDAIAFSIGSVDIYWYGISYVVGLVAAYLVSVQRGKILDRHWSADQISDLLFYVAIGIIFGGRIGFILIYAPLEILTEPFESLKFWLPGRAFHGGHPQQAQAGKGARGGRYAGGAGPAGGSAHQQGDAAVDPQALPLGRWTAVPGGVG